MEFATKKKLLHDLLDETLETNFAELEYSAPVDMAIVRFYDYIHVAPVGKTVWKLDSDDVDPFEVIQEMRRLIKHYAVEV